MRTAIAMLAIGGCLMCGCSDTEQSDLIPVYPVSGRLTKSGAPMGHAIITFVPQSQGIVAGTGRPRAVADEDGRYALTTFTTGDGAPAGDYVVTIYWPEHWEENADPLPPDRLGQAYAEEDSSSLRATVTKDGPNEKNFDLQ